MATSSLGALVVIVALTSSWAMVAHATEYDGVPRPKGFPYNPTAAYGTNPVVYLYDSNQTADCAWYGFANMNFPANIVQQCLTYMRGTVVGEQDPRALKPYKKKYCHTEACKDNYSYDYYCFQACYSLSNGTFVIPPISDPLATAMPPPGTPVALLPPPGTRVVQPPPGVAGSQTFIASSSSLQAHTFSAAFLAVGAAAVSLVTCL